MNDFDLLLDDRIAKIRSINEQYDLLNNSYIAFSGGKDSTILHYLIDLALPNNNIPRIYLNTGLEYNLMVKFVKEMKKVDQRIVIINNKNNIKNTLNKYGFPFKSKKHSNFVSVYQNKYILHKGIQNYLNSGFCPKVLKYQFTKDCNLKISSKCCLIFKEKPVLKFAKENNKTINITGIRKEEGGQRTQANCILLKDNKLVKFHPLLVVSNDWENWFIKKYNIKLCDLYLPPYNFERTGCKGCPFALELEEELTKMSILLPNEYKQCNILWKPVYDEYKRLNYRLHK